MNRSDWRDENARERVYAQIEAARPSTLEQMAADEPTRRRAGLSDYTMAELEAEIRERVGAEHPALAEIRGEIEVFMGGCAAEQYTETGDALDLLARLYVAAGGEPGALSIVPDQDDNPGTGPWPGVRP